MMLGREVRIPAKLKSRVTGDVDENTVSSYGEYATGSEIGCKWHMKLGVVISNSCKTSQEYL